MWDLYTNVDVASRDTGAVSETESQGDKVDVSYGVERWHLCKNLSDWWKNCYELVELHCSVWMVQQVKELQKSLEGKSEIKMLNN